MGMELHNDDTCFAHQAQQEAPASIYHYGMDTSMPSVYSMGRDTSNTCRDGSLNNTRQTVNTQNSILDLSKDEDEEEDDDRSVLFESLAAAVSLDEGDNDDNSAVMDPSRHEKFSLHAIFGDAFVDGLCTSDVANEPPCTISTGNWSPPRFQCNRPIYPNNYNSEDRLTVGTDIWDLLGCTAHPGEAEIEEIWSRRVELSRPCRANIKHRLHRIRQLRTAHSSTASSSRHGVTLASNIPFGRSYTMDHQNDLSRFIGQGMDPIVPNYNDGYDSDPEMLLNEFSSSFPSRRSPSNDVEQVDDFVDEDLFIQDIVQQTLNSTWTFTWHPNPHNVVEFGLESSKPVCVNIWIERGTALPNGHVTEPTIMWRDAYQPHLTGKHQLNKSTQKPWTMRLLNTCRIAECSSNNIDRKTYPLARSQNCFVLKTSQGNHEFLFETPSVNDLSNVTERWKMTVARFASLAVTEDIDTIEREFFHPTSSSPMLIVDEHGDC